MRLKNNTRGPNYRDIFPDPPPPDSVPNCAEGGIIGVLAGIMGCLQAGEVIKVLAGIGEPLSGKLMIWDGLTMESRILKIEKNADNPVSGGKPTITTLIDYDQYCGMSRADELAMSCKIVSPLELRKMIDSDSGYLIDVREPNERDIASIGGVLIPAGEVELHVDKIPRKGQVVIYCRSGERSRKAIEILEREYGYENIYNLEGGILAWAEQVDKSMAKY